VEHRRQLAVVCEQFGAFLEENGQPGRGGALRDRAIRESEGARQVLERRLAADPGDRRAREQLAEVEIAVGCGHLARGRWADAAAALARCRAIARGGEPTAPRPELRALEANAGVRLALALRGERPAEALKLLRASTAAIGEIARGDTDGPGAGHSLDLATALYWLASLEDRLEDRRDDAIRGFRRAVGIYERLLRTDPDNGDVEEALGAAYYNIGRLLVGAGRPAEAIEPYRKAIAIREAHRRRSPARLQGLSDCRGSWHRLSEAFEAIRRYDEALAACREAIRYGERLLGRMPGDPGHRKVLDERLRDLSRLARAMGRPGVAIEAARVRSDLRQGDPSGLLGIACELAAAAVLVPQGKPLLAAARDGDRRRCLVDALAAWPDAARIAARKPHLAGAPNSPPSRPLSGAQTRALSSCVAHARGPLPKNPPYPPYQGGFFGRELRAGATQSLGALN
jgi:tetratricopeptide (TPR) repeat protein